jgi:5-methylcytosine-specific restriction enzyme subunit McrC
MRSASITSEGGRVLATSFVFDMNEVFESFLTTRLTQRFRRHGGWVAAQRSTRLAATIAMRTDITWHGAEGIRAVVDAKYKSLVDSASMPNADAYQMLAYCVALGLQRGYLVYAKDAGQGQHSHRIVRHGYEIEVRAVDVELDPELLLARVDGIADEIAIARREDVRAAA